MNNDNNKLNRPSESHESSTSKIKNIGASIFTLGEDLLELALELAFDALEDVNNQSPQSLNDQSKHSESIQKQIDHLISELEGMKKIMK
ncbi:translation initiation factor 2 [Lysinibacillus sp. NPDC097287]|uniref:translation initiation factor 2 n=1 Tax=Lysinibacillus sp. NPDC097287 TaxID=3364144 RepID=UPI003806EE8D